MIRTLSNQIFFQRRPWRFLFAFFLLGLALTAVCSSAFPQVYDLEDNMVEHARLGQVYMNDERYLEAIEEFKIALQLNPFSSMSAALFNNLGLCYARTRNTPMALASFQRAVRIQPHYELYYKNLIQTYQDAGSLSAAQDALTRIVSINSNDGEAWYLLGLAYEKAGDFEAAKEAFSTFLKLEPNSRLASAARSRR